MCKPWQTYLTILILTFSLSAAAQPVQEEWVRYRQGHYFIGTRAMDLDAAGNIFVVGYNELDYLTLKYDPAGDLLWAAQFGCPGNIWDRASAIAVDQAGNVVVSGHRYDFAIPFGSYVTVKYDPDGTELWAAVFDELDADISGESGDYLAIDGQGNVLVTGQVRKGEDFDIATFKYDAGGQHQWTALFCGQPGGDDAPADITTDADGNVFVTGTSEGTDGLFDYVTIMYDPTGNEVWRSRFDNGLTYWYHQPRLAACPDGGVVIVGGDKWGPQEDDCDFITIRYAPDGTVAWANTYSWSDVEWYEYDYANDVVVDADANVLVTGASYDVDTQSDFATIKYSPTGETIWTARFKGLGGSDWPTAMTLDDRGDVYVTGMMNMWFSTVKYGSDGAEQWSVIWQDPDERYDAWVHDIAVDSQYNVYVQGQNNYTGLTTIKYAQPALSAIEPGADLVSAAAPRLEQNHPNPFNPNTTIEFTLSRSTAVSLRVLDLTGKVLRTLVAGDRPTGRHRITWDGDDAAGRPCPSGLYLYTLDTGGSRQTRSMLLLK